MNISNPGNYVLCSLVTLLCFFSASIDSNRGYAQDQIEDQFEDQDPLEGQFQEAQKRIQEMAEKERAVRAQRQKQMTDMALIHRINMMVHNQGMLDDLEVGKTQSEKLKAIVREVQEKHNQFQRENDPRRIQELFRNGEIKKAQELQREVERKQRELISSPLEEIQDTLLPAQIKRLKQIALQQSLQQINGFTDFFSLPIALADDLELSGKVTQELKKSIAEFRKEYYEKQTKLRQDTMKKILKELKPKQRKQFHELVGDMFDEQEFHRSVRDRELKKREKVMSENRARQQAELERLKELQDKSKQPIQ